MYFWGKLPFLLPICEFFVPLPVFLPRSALIQQIFISWVTDGPILSCSRTDLADTGTFKHRNLSHDNTRRATSSTSSVQRQKQGTEEGAMLDRITCKQHRDVHLSCSRRQRAGLHVCSRTAGKMKQAGRRKRERRVKRRRSCWFTHRSLGWQSEVQPQPPQDTNFLCSPRIMIAVSGVRLYRYRGGSIGFITSTHSQL